MAFIPAPNPPFYEPEAAISQKMFFYTGYDL
jgi:hypothetical protein